jgi:hypothetical protein
MKDEKLIDEILEEYGISLTAFSESLGEYRQKMWSRKAKGWTVEIFKGRKEIVFTNPKNPADKRYYSLKGVKWFQKS